MALSVAPSLAADRLRLGRTRATAGIATAASAAASSTVSPTASPTASPTVSPTASSGPARGPGKDGARSLWDVLVLGTPALDQLNQAWGMAGGANGAALALPKVPAMAGSIGASSAAGILGKAGLLGHVERILGTRAFQAAAGILSRPVFQTAGRIAGRVAPFIGVGFTFFDVRTAYRTGQDPAASDLRKGLKWLKAGVTAVGTAAGFATLLLAPTGAGAVVAGSVALASGFLAMGLDFLTAKIAPR